MLTHVDVSDIREHELLEVAHLCVNARDESALGAQICVGEPERLVRQLGVFAQYEGSHVLVARQEGHIVGFIMMRTVAPGVFVDVPTVYLEAVFVASGARRRGIGHQLLSALCERASVVGATEIYALPLPGSRGLQRFLSRLGFAPAAAHRVVNVATLQRNILAELKRSRRGGPRTLDDLIARRRKARIETNSGPLDLRSFQAALAQEREGADAPPSATTSISPNDDHARQS
ncbi:GNAT family N-acetyltransferase [Timonella sp. A28]|uniref:GNAT family N-acetyltransferase n=1 Tax=Timonella sp. A28 TaxID=3442640 RepID=UPI003EBBCC24